jgi:hypothetical protein
VREITLAVIIISTGEADASPFASGSQELLRKAAMALKSPARDEMRVIGYLNREVW